MKRFREQALAQFRQPENNDPYATNCEECGDSIPEARQRIVSRCRLCVICQTLKEING
ncbi:TraR/DksA C4-type zinc finger protein [Kingella kingae]|uniref:TraR/DksA C4-type zinc finger protein n=1 Tax=Kingella kingae TaxID=504 RepID=UPI0009B72D9B|nr:TraR/DksA C4-type zinc finger protein [Kingella kingae]